MGRIRKQVKYVIRQNSEGKWYAVLDIPNTIGEPPHQFITRPYPKPGSTYWIIQRVAKALGYEIVTRVDDVERTAYKPVM